jgi:hypothetical protein
LRNGQQNDWLSERAFFAIVLTMTAIAACGLASTLNTSSARFEELALELSVADRFRLSVQLV